MYSSVKNNEEYQLMKWVIRDEDTDEIIGLKPNAPTKIKAFYKLFLERQNSKTPNPK